MIPLEREGGAQAARSLSSTPSPVPRAAPAALRSRRRRPAPARIASSRRRWATNCAATPYTPTSDSESASPAKLVTRSAPKRRFALDSRTRSPAVAICASGRVGSTCRSAPREIRDERRRLPGGSDREVQRGRDLPALARSSWYTSGSGGASSASRRSSATDADDGEPGKAVTLGEQRGDHVLRRAHPHHLADRVLARPEASSHRLVHHRDRGTAGTVGGLEAPADDAGARPGCGSSRDSRGGTRPPGPDRARPAVTGRRR